MNTDRIEKKVLLRAPLARVWQALSDSQQFGTWFGITFDAPFASGKTMDGVLTGTKVNPEVADMQRTHAGLKFQITIESMEPQRLFSFRWHPHATDARKDYSSEPTTLVEFALREVPEGVMLTLTESGFDKIPLERRATAFSANEQGWAIMVKVLEAYLSGAY